MNHHLEIYQFLLDALVKWKPKVGNPTVSGEGFNNMNVSFIQPTGLPDIYEFDLVYVGTPIISSSGVTTGAGGVQRSTETYTLDTYTKRRGAGTDGRINTLNALNENTAFITNLLASQGFMINMSQPDLSYANTLIARQVITATKTFIQ